MTAQDVSELDDTEIIALHRNLKPIRAKRMDWRDYPELLERTKTPPPLLQSLPEVADLPSLAAEPDYPERFGP